MRQLIIICSILLLSNTSNWISVEYFSKEMVETFYQNKDCTSLLLVSVKSQKLYHLNNYTVIEEYPISTSKYGLGSTPRSFKTPLGLFSVTSKHGSNEVIGTVFYNAEPSSEVATIYTDQTDTEEDKITSRVIKLDGLEPGKNKGPGVDTYSRKIYIHGTDEEGLIGKPASHGCIRMKNEDIILLFEKIDTMYKVLIVDQ